MYIKFKKHPPVRMVLCKHLLGSAIQLLNGVGVVIHRLLQEHVALQHQHGTLLILEEEEDEEESPGGGVDNKQRGNKRDERKTNELCMEAAT